jgi:U6 snRNA-associated Sm-like protein LSm6
MNAWIERMGEMRHLTEAHRNHPYTGILACLDGYMNIAMEQTQEYVNGQLKNTYADTFIRGNNVLYIRAQK